MLSFSLLLSSTGFRSCMLLETLGMWLFLIFTTIVSFAITSSLGILRRSSIISFKTKVKLYFKRRFSSGLKLTCFSYSSALESVLETHQSSMDASGIKKLAFCFLFRHERGRNVGEDIGEYAVLTFPFPFKDLSDVVDQVCSFLQVSLTEKEKGTLLDQLNINNMKGNIAIDDTELMVQLGLFKANEGSFILKGKSGGWKEYFDDEMMQEMEEWKERNCKLFDVPIEKLWK